MYDETPYQPPLRSRATRSFAARSKSSVRGFLFAHLPAQDRPRQIIYESNLERRVPDRPVFVANFKDIERWSHEGILRAAPHIVDPVPKYPTSPLSSVGKVSYGLQKSPANRPTSHARPYLAVVNVQRWRLDLNKIKMISVPDEDMPKYRLEYGDVLLCEGEFTEFASERIDTPHTHGTGCTYSAAITAELAKGVPLREAVARSKRFIAEAIRTNPGLGHGCGPVNHHCSLPRSVKKLPTS